jgi:hypothetical protein
MNIVGLLAFVGTEADKALPDRDMLLAIRPDLAKTCTSCVEQSCENCMISFSLGAIDSCTLGYCAPINAH